jgi:hypothetical protein
MTTSTRKRGATGVVLDGEKLLAAVALTGVELDKLRLDAPLLLVYTAAEGPCVLLTEGVGYPPSAEGTISIPTIYGFAGWGWCEVPTEAVVACATDEVVDIADHIRVFGARLESNFALWYRAITEESGAAL